MLGNQILELRERLPRAVIIENEAFEEGIKIGSSVKVIFEDGKKMEFTLTDSEMDNLSMTLLT